MNRPKSLPRKGLGRGGPGAVALSPYATTTYANWTFLGLLCVLSNLSYTRKEEEQARESRKFS